MFAIEIVYSTACQWCNLPFAAFFTLRNETNQHKSFSGSF